MRKLQPQFTKALKEGGKMSTLLELVKDPSHNFFLGIRTTQNKRGNAMVYFMGGKILDIKFTNDKTPSITIDKEYFDDSTIPDEFERNKPETWCSGIEELKTIVKRHQDGKRTNKPPQTKKREKIIQQRILLQNNISVESDYYIVDMEYSMPGIAYGRFDFIALKKEKSGGKYKIAVIELKQGSGVFGTSYNKKNFEERRNSYGSGIVGHAWNFAKFLQNESQLQYGKEKDQAPVSPISYLVNDIVNIISNYKELGLIDKALFPEINDGKGSEYIETTPDAIETFFLCANPAKSSETSIKKYIGVHKPAKYNVEKCIDVELNMNMSDRLRFAFFNVPRENDATFNFSLKEDDLKFITATSDWSGKLFRDRI